MDKFHCASTFKFPFRKKTVVSESFTMDEVIQMAKIAWAEQASKAHNIVNYEYWHEATKAEDSPTEA